MQNQQPPYGQNLGQPLRGQFKAPDLYDSSNQQKKSNFKAPSLYGDQEQVQSSPQQFQPPQKVQFLQNNDQQNLYNPSQFNQQNQKFKAPQLYSDEQQQQPSAPQLYSSNQPKFQSQQLYDSQQAPAPQYQSSVQKQSYKAPPLYSESMQNFQQQQEQPRYQAPQLYDQNQQSVQTKQSQFKAPPLYSDANWQPQPQQVPYQQQQQQNIDYQQGIDQYQSNSQVKNNYEAIQQNQMDYSQFRKEISKQVNNQDYQNPDLGEQSRLRDRIGYFNKNVDNVLVNAPDPTSSHFLPENDRFNKDFAKHEKMLRDQQLLKKKQIVDSKRIQKYERDMKRWEYMEDQAQREQQKVGAQKDKYQIGHANKPGAAFNILNLQYENTQEGQYLQQKDHDKNVRNLLRSKNIDSLGNNSYNLINGNDRQTVDVPAHHVYNPPGSSGSTFSKVGAAIFDGGHAGRPLRGMEKEFGKRVVSGYSSAADQYQLGINQSQVFNQRNPINYQSGIQNNYNYSQPNLQRQEKQNINQYVQGGAGTKFF